MASFRKMHKCHIFSSEVFGSMFFVIIYYNSTHLTLVDYCFFRIHSFQVAINEYNFVVAEPLVDIFLLDSLPEGWERIVTYVRPSDGKEYYSYVNPDGKKFSSRDKMLAAVNENKLKLKSEVTSVSAAKPKASGKAAENSIKKDTGTNVISIVSK